MNLKALAEKLQTAGLGTIGTNIFRQSMPSDCEEGIVVKAPMLGIPYDHYLPGYFKAPIQVIVRAKTFEAGETKANEVIALLKSYKPFNLTEGAVVKVRVKQMLPKTKPISYPRSDGNGLEFSINFDTVYTEPS